MKETYELRIKLPDDYNIPFGRCSACGATLNEHLMGNKTMTPFLDRDEALAKIRSVSIHDLSESEATSLLNIFIALELVQIKPKLSIIDILINQEVFLNSVIDKRIISGHLTQSSAELLLQELHRYDIRPMKGGFKLTESEKEDIETAQKYTATSSIVETNTLIIIRNLLGIIEKRC